MREIVSPLDGIRSPFGFIRGGGIVPFSPSSLFASGEEGAWYEPSPTTCFTDTAGTIAATYGDAVARINDLSGNGNHATQVTSTARPILARVPPRGRVNELSETDTLATQSVTVTAAQRTLSFTGTGTITLTGASMAGPLVGTGAGDRVSLTFTPSAGTLTLTVLGTVTDAQLELGASATTYQSVADSLGYDITEAGVTSLEYLAFDGSDDGMATASIDFTATDKMSVFAGVEKESESQPGVIAEFSIDAIQEHGSFLSLVNGSTGAADYRIYATGSIVPVVTFADSDDAQASLSVFTALHDIPGDSSVLRISGTQIDENTADKGTGNFGNYPLYIGARAATSLFFDGKLFSLIVRGAASTAQEISDTETYLAAKSGVTL